MLANESGLPVYRRVTLEGRIRNCPFSMLFLVSQIADDGILRISGTLIGISMPLEEIHICKGDSIGQCAGIQDTPSTDDCPPYMTTLLEQVL